MQTKKLGSRSSTNDVLQDKDLNGQTIIITGSNGGIGFEAAQALAGAGAKVIFACRNEQAGKDALQRCLALHPNCSAEFVALDLSSVESIYEFCEQLKDSVVDTLICNAGLVSSTYKETEAGMEMTVAVCHFGHFLLTQQLMAKLLKSKAPRVVMVSSESHRMPKTLNFNKFPLKQDQFSWVTAYGQAKLCNALFANELQRRYESKGLTACSLHPGNLITTDIGRDSGWMSIGMKLISPLTKNANQGASTTVYCASHDDPEALAGKYFSHCNIARSSKEANSEEVAKKLWKISESWIDELEHKQKNSLSETCAS